MKKFLFILLMIVSPPFVVFQAASLWANDHPGEETLPHACALGTFIVILQAIKIILKARRKAQHQAQKPSEPRQPVPKETGLTTDL